MLYGSTGFNKNNSERCGVLQVARESENKIPDCRCVCSIRTDPNDQILYLFMCSFELLIVWVVYGVVYGERKPTLDRLDSALPHTIGIVDAKRGRQGTSIRNQPGQSQSQYTAPQHTAHRYRSRSKQTGGALCLSCACLGHTTNTAL